MKAGAEGDITPGEGETTSQGVVWMMEGSGLANPSPLLYEGKIYLVSSRGGEVHCIEAATGKSLYKQKVEKTGACRASPWANNGKVFFLDERGTTRVLGTGDVFELPGNNTLEGKFWASPAFTRDACIFRSNTKVWCLRNTAT